MDRVHNNSSGSQQPTPQAHKSLPYQLLWMFAPSSIWPIPHLPGSVISALGDNTESVIDLLIAFFFLIAFFTDGWQHWWNCRLSGQSRGWDSVAEVAKISNSERENRNQKEQIREYKMWRRITSGSHWEARIDTRSGPSGFMPKIDTLDVKSYIRRMCLFVTYWWPLKRVTLILCREQSLNTLHLPPRYAL